MWSWKEYGEEEEEDESGGGDSNGWWWWSWRRLRLREWERRERDQVREKRPR
jgi:hypothetical protein